MAALILPSRRVVQPQGPVEINYGNPIARDLREAVLSIGPVHRYLEKKVFGNYVGALTAPVVSGKYGFGAQNYASSTGNILLNRPIPSNSNATIFTVGRVASAATKRSVTSLAQNASGTMLSVQVGDGATPGVITGFSYLGGSGAEFGGSFTLQVGDDYCAAVRQVNGVKQDLWVNGFQDPLTASRTGNSINYNYFGRGGATASGIPLFTAFAWARALLDDEIRAVSENPWQLFRPIQRRIIVDLGAGGGAGATASATPATVTTTALTATATGAASAQATPAQVTAAPAPATATGGASAQATPAAASITPATGTATGAALASSEPASVQLTPATATASGESGASVEATATPAPITIAAATATATGSASAQATTAQVTTTAPTATAASGISASATLAAIGLMPATGVATGGAIASAIPAQIIIAPAQATATGSAWAFSAPAQINITTATGSASEYIKPLYSEDPSAQFVGYPVDDHSVDYPLRLMAVNYPFDSNKVDFPLRVLRVNYPKQ